MDLNDNKDINSLDFVDENEELVGISEHNFKDEEEDKEPTVVKVKTAEDEPILSPTRVAINRFLSNKIAVAGLILFAIILFSVIFVPILSSHSLRDFELAGGNQAPSATHWLGTDQQGRDVFFRLFLGGRISLQTGFIASVLSVFLGSVIGATSGYYGGRVDKFIMRFTEIIMSLPFLPMMMALAAVMVWTPQNLRSIMVAGVIGILSWGGLARLVRGQILSLREQEFMQATNALGLSDSSKIFRHLLPNVLSLIIVNGTLTMAGAILSESALSFLGLGVVPPTPSWGNLMQLATNTNNLRNFPWTWMPAGIMCLLTVVSINLIGEGLRDALDPKSVR